MYTELENGRPVTSKSPEEKQQELDLAVQQLRDAGFEVKAGKKTPKNGVYSGIVGELGRVLQVNINR